MMYKKIYNKQITLMTGFVVQGHIYLFLIYALITWY